MTYDSVHARMPYKGVKPLFSWLCSVAEYLSFLDDIIMLQPVLVECAEELQPTFSRFIVDTHRKHLSNAAYHALLQVSVAE